MKALAQKGNAIAQYNLGMMDARVGTVSKKQKYYKSALKWFRLAAGQGHASAQYQMGQIYIYGKGIPKNEKTAQKWYRLAAEQGNDHARSHLENLQKTISTRKRAEKGDVNAQNKLGEMYRDGRDGGGTNNFKTALKWFRLAAKQGNGGAQYNLAAMYYNGYGVLRNNTTAVKWYRLAAEQGYTRGQKMLGWMYEWGLGVPENYLTAEKWYRLAAKHGNAGALTRLRNFLKRKISRQKPKTTVTAKKIPSLPEKLERNPKVKTAPKAIAKKSSPPLKMKKTPDPKPSQRKKSTSDPDKVITASSGSGFAVSSVGHVITNNHVINGCNKVKIHHKGNAIRTTIVTIDPVNDLALLKGNFKPTSTFPLSRENPQLLQEIYVSGFPFGRNISKSVKVTKGIISSLTGIGNNVSRIQIDAALQPGSSGGPIINDKGNVVGVAVAKLDLKEVVKRWGVIPENINFGVKSNVVLNLLKSNNVSVPHPNNSAISTIRLGEMISDGTYYVSCWMTMAQIKKMRAKKVIFSNLE